jgi:hypothetical protein
MDYNTARQHLILPEYGRNIQKMVEEVKNTEDRETRNYLAKAVIQVMGNMNPHLRDVSDYTHKLWDHLAIISNFELDIDSPYPVLSKEELTQKPEHLGYSNRDRIKFKHYGRVLEDMIKRAVSYEDGKEKDYLIEIICTQMKKSFVTWNRGNVDDKQIFNDLIYLSNNMLKIPEGLILKDARVLAPKKPITGGRDKKYSKKDNKKQYQQKGRKKY